MTETQAANEHELERIKAEGYIPCGMVMRKPDFSSFVTVSDSSIIQHWNLNSNCRLSDSATDRTIQDLLNNGPVTRLGTNEYGMPRYDYMKVILEEMQLGLLADAARIETLERDNALYEELVKTLEARVKKLESAIEQISSMG